MDNTSILLFPGQEWDSRLTMSAAVHGHSQAFFFFFFLVWGPIGAVAAGLCHSHSKARSEPHLQPPPQLTAMPDP